MGDENPIRTLGGYSKPIHKGYRNTIELPEGNNVVPLRFDTIWLVQNKCSFHRLRSEDLNQHLKDFLKLVESLYLDVANRERTQDFFLKHGLVSRTYSKKSFIMASIFGSVSKSFMTMSIPSQDDLSINRPVAISLPQDVSSTSDHRLIKLENQVQCLMEAHLAPKQLVQVNKISSSCEICSGPHDTQNCMENFEQAFIEYASSRTDEAGGLVSNFMASQDARLSKFESDFKQQQGKMTHKIDTVLKAITDRITGALPSEMVKNPKLNINVTSPVLSALS
nr:MAK10-like protein [Tanacetum cinerariifolium]